MCSFKPAGRNRAAAAAEIRVIKDQKLMLDYKVVWVSLLLDLHRLMSPTLDNKNSNQSVSPVCFSTSCTAAKCQKLEGLFFFYNSDFIKIWCSLSEKKKELADQGGFTRLHQNGGWHYPWSDSKHTRSPTFCLCTGAKPLTSRSRSGSKR